MTARKSGSTSRSAWRSASSAANFVADAFSRFSTVYCWTAGAIHEGPVCLTGVLIVVCSRLYAADAAANEPALLGLSTE